MEKELADVRRARRALNAALNREINAKFPVVARDYRLLLKTPEEL